MKNNRFVVDTNVLISALLFKQSIPFHVIKIVEKEVILYSELTLYELNQVLTRKKFDKYLTLEESQIFIIKFITSSQLIPITETISACRDVKDNKFLELAVNGNAEAIITGDKDLLVLNPFREIKIITPDFFLK